MLDRTISAVGCSIFSPDGEPVGDLMLDEAGLVFGHIELERPLTGKLMHNIIGHYIQPAILGLYLDARRQRPLRYARGQQELVENSHDPGKNTSEPNVSRVEG